MNLLTTKLTQLSQQHRKALSMFVTAGYPTLETTVPLAVEMAKAGADILELGIPFSDPVADGPVIQASSEAALRNGITLQTTLEMVKQIRKQSNVPIMLMGYANPIFSMGMEFFFSTCKAIGVDGVIVPDLPLEESQEYRAIAQRNEIATIMLASPTTPDERLIQLDKASSGFLYCVSITGVTGARQQISEQAKEFLARAKAHVKNNPLLVGFGISTPEDAVQLSQYADGVIIGSALVKILQQSSSSETITNAVKFVHSVRDAFDA